MRDSGWCPPFRLALLAPPGFSSFFVLAWSAAGVSWPPGPGAQPWIEKRLLPRDKLVKAGDKKRCGAAIFLAFIRAWVINPGFGNYRYDAVCSDGVEYALS
jgi:hypothetical protein